MGFINSFKSDDGMGIRELYLGIRFLYNFVDSTKGEKPSQGFFSRVNDVLRYMPSNMKHIKNSGEMIPKIISNIDHKLGSAKAKPKLSKEANDNFNMGPRRYYLKILNEIFEDNKDRKGKAVRLNQGIIASEGEFVACMDADSELSRDTILKTIPYFDDEKTGAVTVAVKLKRVKNLLEKIIEIEYIIGLSLALKALSFLNSIHVTPGPFSIYRRKVLDEIGYFDVNNITEDLEIAYRIQKHGYKINCCTATHVKTITPNTLKRLYIQRKRWYSGALMTYWQHRKLLFNSKLGTFAFFVPYNFFLVTLGLTLFIFSLCISLSNFFKSFGFYSLTNFNFLSYIDFSKFDLLSTSSLMIIGMTSVLITLIATYLCLGLNKTKVKTKVPGFVGFFALFFLYQAFWAASFFSVLAGRKIRWR